MDEDRFDAIVVGGGVAGLTAAYVMAKEGLAVLLVERSTTCGAKNVTGGKICSHSIERVFPGFGSVAPVERRVTEEKVYHWSGNGVSECGIDAGQIGLTKSDAYVVIRAKLDSWMAEQAENEGAMIIQGIRVDDLIVRDGKVCGIVADGEEMEANVVVLAEGVNALLAQKLGMVAELSPDETCIGTKEVIELGESVVNERFGIASGEGVEWMFLGDHGAGRYADGFVYTNKDSVSVGIEFTVGDIGKTEKSIPEMLEEFKACGPVARLLEGGRLIEYASHLVRKGGAERVGKLYGDGVLLVGDTAGLVANAGFAVRGMDLAVESGRLAAQAVAAACEGGDFSAPSLASYQRAVEESCIAADLAACDRYLKRVGKGE